MLVTVVLPFSDLRPLLVSGFQRLRRPEWPAPQPEIRFMRGIGRVKERHLKGFEGWVGEDCLAVGLPGATLRLPRSAPGAGLLCIRLLRKACFFDGLMNGRFEFLFHIDPMPDRRGTPVVAVRTLLSTRIVVRSVGFDGPLSKAAGALARLWARATVRRNQDDHAEAIPAGRPFCVVEAEDLPKVGTQSDGAVAVGLDVAFRIDQDRKPYTEWFLITPRHGVAVGKTSAFRYGARFVRTYMLRLLQDVESMRLMLDAKLDHVDEDLIQNLLNEYTRRINRSRQRLDDGAKKPVLDYCYSAFERIRPGRIDAIRVKVVSSNLRPNVAKKFLQFLDLVESSNVVVMGSLTLEEKVMGDKYQDINVTGSKKVAIGHRAKAGNAVAPAVSGSAGAQFDRVAAVLAALVVVGLAVFLLVRNEPIADPKLFFVLRVVVSFAAAVLGATIPGFLDLRWSGGGLVVRAGGALALFVLTFVFTPDLVTGQDHATPAAASASGATGQGAGKAQ